MMKRAREVVEKDEEKGDKDKKGREERKGQKRNHLISSPFTSTKA